MNTRLYKYRIRPDDQLSSENNGISLLNGLYITDDLSAFVLDIGDMFLVHWFWMDKIDSVYDFKKIKECLSDILIDRVKQSEEDEQRYHLMTKDGSLISEHSYDSLCDNLLAEPMVENKRNFLNATEVFNLDPFRKIQSGYRNKLNAPFSVEMVILSENELYLLIEVTEIDSSLVDPERRYLT